MDWWIRWNPWKVCIYIELLIRHSISVGAWIDVGPHETRDKPVILSSYLLSELPYSLNSTYYCVEHEV
jgi:hypothetical protein